jgi:pilus assembly protein Flp/PilA
MLNRIWLPELALPKDDSGQDLIEYALIAGLIGLCAVAAMNGMVGAIGTAFNPASLANLV